MVMTKAMHILSILSEYERNFSSTWTDIIMNKIDKEA